MSTDDYTDFNDGECWRGLMRAFHWERPTLEIDHSLVVAFIRALKAVQDGVQSRDKTTDDDQAMVGEETG